MTHKDTPPSTSCHCVVIYSLLIVIAHVVQMISLHSYANVQVMKDKQKTSQTNKSVKLKPKKSIDSDQYLV